MLAGAMLGAAARRQLIIVDGFTATVAAASARSARFSIMFPWRWRRSWTAVVGPNGSGKSTLLRTLAGLKKPAAGSISLYGRPLSAWPRRERARRLAWLA